MKGTVPRDPDPDRGRDLANALRQSPKDRAENLMIVDLLRNDLSRICQAGSVQVPRLFAIETFATVHQMVSEVIGLLREDMTLSAILQALFPCGSVTGAPKIRAMEVIRDTEDVLRGIYCGSTRSPACFSTSARVSARRPWLVAACRGCCGQSSSTAVIAACSSSRLPTSQRRCSGSETRCAA